MHTFAELPILESLRATLAEGDFTRLTEIQRLSMPLLLSGSSVVGISETGSGKTFAYALPVLHLLKKLEDEGNKVKTGSQPRALVVVPTRELGEQVTRVFKTFTHATRLRVRAALGGAKMEVTRRNVEGLFEILIATPGRLTQLMDRQLVFLNDVRFLAFDEADQLLDPGFQKDAQRIAEACAPACQKALFTATCPEAMENLITNLFEGAVTVQSRGSHRTVKTLETINKLIADGNRFPVLEQILAKPVEGGTIAFTNTREQCDRLAELLENAGIPCAIYRGEMEKLERRTNLKSFREGRVKLLVSTDLGSRGLDVEHVGRVINYHLPRQLDNYLHRVGRTARAGRRGIVINFVTERDQPLMKRVATIRYQKPGA